jgi:eukaryotic-like serine/threonine-protein kinase
MDLRQLGKYEIVGKIGQGAMGEVFKAHDPILGRDVAIKTMTATIGTDEELRKRFHREAQSAARLSHPNIITIYDFGEDQGKVYMAMELLEGNDLKDLIGRHTPMSLEQKLGLMEQICDGLAFAHGKDVVHRDLKPANIHIQRGGQIKIMDFGLAKLSSSDMTRAGMIMGTPNYMSPEQVRGEKATARSDVFSLGAVFYELLTNRKPFEADSLHAVLFQVMQNEPEPLSNLIPDIPPALQQVVERAMLKDPTARYRDAGEMREGLRPARSAMAQWMGATIVQPADATIIGIFDPVTQPPSVTTRPPSPGSRPPAHPPTPLPTTDGAMALEPKLRAPADTVSPKQPGTLSGRASTQVPAATPATPVPQPTPQPPVPAPVAHPPTPIPSKSHPPAPIVHPPTPLPTVPLPSFAPPVVMRPPAPPPPPPPVAPAARQVRPTTAAPVARPVAAEPPRPTEPPRVESPAPRDGGAAWKMPVFAGGAVLVVLAAVGIYLATRPEEIRPTPPPVTTEQAVDPAIARHVEQAQRALANRSFKAALEQANLALQKDPQNAAARQVVEQAQAAQKRIEAAVADVRRAIEAKDVAAASRGLEALIREDPANPAVPEFREALNGAFRSRAEQAQAEMKQAQREATQARATSQAEFKAAILTGREAEALLARNEFVNATQKFYQARDGFTRAREAQQVAVPTPVAVAMATPVPITTPTTLAPVPTPTTAPPSTTATNEEPAIRRLIADFERAFETGDVALWKSIRPGAADSELKSVAQKNWKQVNITIESIDVFGTRAIVRIARKDLGADGKTYPFAQTLTLMREPSGWKITSLGR